VSGTVVIQEETNLKEEFCREECRKKEKVLLKAFAILIASFY